MSTILIAEDNRSLAFGLRRTLEENGYDVAVAHDGAMVLQMARRTSPDLVLLDIGLPVADGLEVLRALRQEELDIPVLILTARKTEEDTIEGFRLGADDYLTKPFRVRELLARIRAVLRRTGAKQLPVASSADSERTEPITFGDVEVDTARCIVKKAGEVVVLRPKEYDLLDALIACEGRVASRAELLRAVWGYDPMVASRTVDTHMLELRRKLESDPASPRHLITIRTRGYRLAR